MKKALQFCLAVLIAASAMMFSACGNNQENPSAAHPGETPLGVKYRQEKGYLTYLNENYLFRMDYPDIFTETKEGDDGILLTNEDCELRAWAVENSEGLNIDEAYETAMGNYSDISGNVCGRAYFAFEFMQDGSRGYYYSMIVKDVLYTFRFIYPEEEKDKFETYCVDIATTFVVTGTYQGNEK